MPGNPKKSHTNWAPMCDEYFKTYSEGVYDVENFIQLVLSAEELIADYEKGDLIVGYPGIDGIYFCFRKNQAGIWAYMPLDDAYILLADSISEFLINWENGRIAL